jgi:hypothetical protein
MPRIHHIAVVLSRLAGGGTTGGLPDALDIVLLAIALSMKIRQTEPKCFVGVAAESVEAHFYPWMAVEMDGIDKANFGLGERHDE